MYSTSQTPNWWLTSAEQKAQNGCNMKHCLILLWLPLLSLSSGLVSTWKFRRTSTPFKSHRTYKWGKLFITHRQISRAAIERQLAYGGGGVKGLMVTLFICWNLEWKERGFHNFKERHRSVNCGTWIWGEVTRTCK